MIMGLASPLGIDVDPAGEAPRTLTSATYLQIRSGIITGRYGASEYLNVSGLSKQFRVSLSVIREALQRLVADGWVIAADQRGFCVAPVSQEELLDLTETRVALEGLVLRHSIAEGGPAWEQEMSTSWELLSQSPYASPAHDVDAYRRWSIAHTRFHSALLTACKLMQLKRFCLRLFEKGERYLQLGLPIEPMPREEVQEHKRIFQATLDRDTEAAVNELAAHYRMAASRIRDRIIAIENRASNDRL